MSTGTAIVTGASEGIGRAFCVRLVKDGWKVLGVARNEKRLRELTMELGPNFSYIEADLSTDQGVESVAEHIRQNRVNLLINNAGFGVYGEFRRLPLERFKSMLRVNVDALVTLSHVFLRNAQSGDALVNVSSVLAFLPMPTGGLYSATKALVTSFSESLWYQNRGRGVYVMGLCPGATETRFHERAGGSPSELPKALMQSAEQVVDVAMKALADRKKPTVVSGPKNRAAVFTHRVFSRKGLVSMMGARK